MSQELKGQSPKGLSLLSKTVGHGGRLPVLLLMAVKHGSYMDLAMVSLGTDSESLLSSSVTCQDV